MGGANGSPPHWSSLLHTCSYWQYSQLLSVVHTVHVHVPVATLSSAHSTYTCTCVYSNHQWCSMYLCLLQPPVVQYVPASILQPPVVQYVPVSTPTTSGAVCTCVYSNHQWCSMYLCLLQPPVVQYVPVCRPAADLCRCSALTSSPQSFPQSRGHTADSCPPPGASSGYCAPAEMTQPALRPPLRLAHAATHRPLLMALGQHDDDWHVVLPHHPPEVCQRVLEWALSRDEGIAVVVALQEGGGGGGWMVTRAPLSHITHSRL